jgi:hypothetical protein
MVDLFTYFEELGFNSQQKQEILLLSTMPGELYDPFRLLSHEYQELFCQEESSQGMKLTTHSIWC